MKISDNRHQPDGVALPKTKAARGATQAAQEDNINGQYSKLKRFIQRLLSLCNSFYRLHLYFTWGDGVVLALFMLIWSLPIIMLR